MGWTVYGCFKGVEIKWIVGDGIVEIIWIIGCFGGKLVGFFEMRCWVDIEVDI